MTRRDFVAFVTCAVSLVAVAARAQQKAMPLIGWLGNSSPAIGANSVAAFRQGLGEIGYVEGQNVAFEYRWAEDHYERLPALADDLARLKVDLIVAGGRMPAAFAAKNATSTIPIVVTTIADPVGAGLVTSLARPGGNVTGISILARELTPKRLQLISEFVPRAKTIAFLVNPNAANESVTRQLQEAAEVKGVQIVALASRYAVPAIYFTREYTASGGLISYGPNLPASYRQAGVYAGKILKGAKPADLPVEQPTKFELVINLKTATALGLTVPQSLLARADEVIE